MFNLYPQDIISEFLLNKTTTSPSAGTWKEMGRSADEPFLQILNPSHALLRVANHLTKEISKAGLAELLCAAAI